MVSKFGNDDQYRVESAKLLTLLLFTLRGTVYIYQGDEIGMTNVAFDSFDDYNDVEIRNTYNEWVEKGLDTNKLLKAVHKSGRDNARTPVQWNDTPNAGFTPQAPWLKINPNYKSINVESQEKDKNSILNFYRQVIQFRKSHLTLVYGDFLIIEPDHPDIFAYQRWDNDKAYLVLLNFSDHDQLFQVDDKILSGNPESLITNYHDEKQFDLINNIEL
jgi:oligo-1,6-glucosidase